MVLVRVTSHIKVTHPPCFILVAIMGKCKQINNSNLQYMSDIIHQIVQFCQHCASYLKYCSTSMCAMLCIIAMEMLLQFKGSQKQLTVSENKT